MNPWVWGRRVVMDQAYGSLGLVLTLLPWMLIASSIPMDEGTESTFISTTHPTFFFYWWVVEETGRRLHLSTATAVDLSTLWRRKGRDVSYDAPVVKAHQFPQHFHESVQDSYAVGLNGRLYDKSSIHMHESLVIFFILLVLEMKKIDSCIQSQHQR